MYKHVYMITDNNPGLQEFLRARNPKQQHSSTLESYLIKPIQRILKYPLLLQQLKNLTDPASDEHHHLAGTSTTERYICVHECILIVFLLECFFFSTDAIFLLQTFLQL